VWQETLQILEELFEQVWGDSDSVVVGHASEMTMSVRTKKQLRPLRYHLTTHPSYPRLRSACSVLLVRTIQVSQVSFCFELNVFSKALARSFRGSTTRPFLKDTR
jgi:hypothetical protein